MLDELKRFNFKKNILLESSDSLTIDAIKMHDCKVIYQDSKGYGDALKKESTQLTQNTFVFLTQMDRLILKN